MIVRSGKHNVRQGHTTATQPNGTTEHMNARTLGAEVPGRAGRAGAEADGAERARSAHAAVCSAQGKREIKKWVSSAKS